MAKLLKTHFKIAKTAIKENRTRSFLTCVGIAIGVASIILILSLMGSISNLVRNEVNEIGNDLIVVRPNSTKNSITSVVEELTASNSFQKSNLTISDISTISKVNNVSAIAPIAISTNTMASEKNTFSSVPILGTTEDFVSIEPFTLKYGSFIKNNSESKTIVLGHTLSLALFNTINSTVGKTVTIMGEKFMVVGVLDEINKSINLSKRPMSKVFLKSLTILNPLSLIVNLVTKTSVFYMATKLLTLPVPSFRLFLVC